MMCVNKDYSCTSYRRSALSSGTIAALVIALSGIAVSLLALTNVI